MTLPLPNSTNSNSVNIPSCLPVTALCGFLGGWRFHNRQTQATAGS